MAQHDHAHAAIGQAAPDFSLKSVDGKKVSLADFKGKIVVLEWTNHTCPYVKRYVAKKKVMQKTARHFARENVVWLAIDSSHYCMEKLDGIKTFVSENKVTYPVLLDPEGKVGHQYGAKTTPHMFVIDQAGILAYQGSFDDDKSGDAKNPRNYVHEVVDALVNGSTVPVSKTRTFGCSVKYKQ